MENIGSVICTFQQFKFCENIYNFSIKGLGFFIERVVRK